MTNRGGDCNGAFLPHRECVCYERCPRCSVEFELDVSFDEANPHRSEEELMAPLTVSSQDLKSNNENVIPAHFLNQDEQDESQDSGVAIVKMTVRKTVTGATNMSGTDWIMTHVALHQSVY